MKKVNVYRMILFGGFIMMLIRYGPGVDFYAQAQGGKKCVGTPVSVSEQGSQVSMGKADSEAGRTGQAAQGKAEPEAGRTGQVFLGKAGAETNRNNRLSQAGQKEQESNGGRKNQEEPLDKRGGGTQEIQAEKNAEESQVKKEEKMTDEEQKKQGKTAVEGTQARQTQTEEGVDETQAKQTEEGADETQAKQTEEGADETQAKQAEGSTEENQSQQGDHSDGNQGGQPEGGAIPVPQEKRDRPFIQEFRITEDQIYTKEKTKWYAAYDEKCHKAHITFFIKVLSRCPCKVSVQAGDGSMQTELAADLTGRMILSEEKNREDGTPEGEERDREIAGEVKETGRAGEWTGDSICSTYSLDFDLEGTWKFTVLVADEQGMTNQKKLDIPGSIVISHVCPVLEVTYPEPAAMVRDSGRLAENKRELFYQAYPSISISLEWGDEGSSLAKAEVLNRPLEDAAEIMLGWKASDAEKDYRILEDRALDFGVYGKKITEFGPVYTATGFPEEDGHGYLKIRIHDWLKNGAGRVEDSNGYGVYVKEEDGMFCYVSPVITLDRTPPVIMTSIADEAGGVLGNRTFYNKEETLTILVRDENFRCGHVLYNGGSEPGQLFSVTCSAYDMDPETKDPAGEKYKVKWEEGPVWDQGHYEKGHKEYTGQIKLTEEWNYEIRSAVTDLAGNVAKPVKDELTIDSTRPYISVRDKENTLRSDVLFMDSSAKEKVAFYDYIQYGYFHKGTMRVKITAHDKVAGLASIGYRVVHEDGRIVKGEWTFKTQEGEQTKILTIPADSRAKITLRPVDHGGLAGRDKTPRGSVTESMDRHQDQADLEIRILTEPVRRVDGLAYYNSRVQADIYMEDKWSGIAAYSYSAGSSILVQEDLTKKAGSQDKQGDPEDKITYARTFQLHIPAGDLNHSDKKDPTVIRASFTDHAGYESSKEERIVIDSIDPQIRVTWTGKEESPDQVHYRSRRTAVIRVIERNFSEEGVSWRIHNGEKARIGDWEHDGDIHTCRVDFGEDGDDYLLDFTVTDLAGNMSACPVQQSFGIDMTPPVIRLLLDDQQPKSGFYYNKARFVVLMIDEHNFKAADVDCSMSCKTAGGKTELYDPEKWTGSRDRHKNAIMCTEDGIYRLKISCVDAAGNPARSVIHRNFVLDRTPPGVRIMGIKDGGTYNDVAAPVVEYQDLNLLEESVKISLTRNSPGQQVPGWEKKEYIYQGRRVRWRDFERKSSSDDIYTLSVEVEDRAGNQNEEAKAVFTINRSGSDYEFSEETSTFLDREYPYDRSPVPIEVTEHNVSSLKEKKVTVRDENNDIRTLTEGEDYLIKQKQEDNGWNSYRYQIKAANFTEEGQYTVTLFSLDEAGNRMTNVTRNKEISFVIDRTSPHGSITGLEEKSYREDRHAITLRADDNYALKEASLYINGVLKKTYEPEEFSEGAGITEWLRGQNTVQKVSLKLTDRAGNSRTILPEDNPYGSLITTDGLTRLLHHPRLFAGMIAAALLILLIIISVVWKILASGKRYRFG